MLTIPKEKGIEYYKKARKSLGIGLCTIAIYCLVRMLIGHSMSPYVEFWLLVTITLIHSWLTYASLLFLLEIPHYLTKNFFVDGIIPTSFLLICGLLGLAFPAVQQVMIVIFGCIFGIKCIRLFYICHKEYNKCVKELENYYDESPDISWINRLNYLALFMSAFTLVSFYIPSTHLAYYLSVPIIYAYIVYRVMDFMPRKIENIRAKNINIRTEEEKPQMDKDKSLTDKIGSKVEKWVSEKNFCQADLTIKDVAMQIGTNHSYLSSYLNKSLNMSFQTWLNTLRIEESKVLLTSGEKLSIEEVGTRVGIPQSYNFSRWFRAVTDTTPYQYRKAHSKK